ncbi:ribonuclease H-like domain-containing protein [Candidatus Micrarchaeota archaeon]|nr:ribonuclease H-like domain-containing protein [Candidatus Micrarchaeota archaeon]
MLENSFIHLPDYGPRRERRLWESGISCWDDFLDRFGASRFHTALCGKIASSKYALQSSDADYFSKALPRGEAWRAFPSFPKVAYVDIETTGLAPATDYMTVVGLYDGKKVHSYVHGKNLDDFRRDIAAFDMVVTFNGSMFDLPFIRKSYPGIRLPPLHVDLRFLLASLDVRGGLKRIEQQFGMEREDDLKGMNGYDAVLLWQRYLRRKEPAVLDKLVRYNAADITNLKILLEWAYKEKRLRTGFDEMHAAPKGGEGRADSSG